jgi:glycosyltransferase involved in cell wall biosynthesis
VTLCLVDDGSSDGTRRVLEDVARTSPGRVVVLTGRARTGKAEAVRHGILHGLSHSEAGLLGYWDADMATPLAELDVLMSACTTDRIAAIGSRVKRLGTRITRSLVRHYLGRTFATFASITLRLPVYDSQCGAKVFRRDAAAAGFTDAFLTKWLFDVEILARLRNRYGLEGVAQAIIEVPLNEWTHVGGSKLRLRHYLIAPLDLWRIARAYNHGLGRRS